MKLIYAFLVLCLSLTAHAEVLKEQVTLESDWKPDYLLKSGGHSCPGGTLELDDWGIPYCVGGKKGLHGRGSEAYSCLDNSEPYDPRVEGTLWMQINSNWYADYTGPVWGKWKAVPGESCSIASLINPDVYWEGTWHGNRKLVSDSPPIWVDFIKVVGHGVGGDLEGLIFGGTEEVTFYTPMPVPWELLPWLGSSGPESIIHAEIQGKVKK